ncbi:MAG: transcription termination factor NusA [Treponema sp.]|nr:transcription termination factor NusA [Treponema sp.]MCL2251148.1 transcription termination factor NusA [Treponema sp.]
MATDISHAIKQLNQDKGIPEELILKTIEDTLIAAYKHRFGHADNAIVQFDDDNLEVTIYAKKRIVEQDDVYDPVTEIDLDEARAKHHDAEIGDEILVEIDPKEFDRIAVQSAKQKAHQTMRDFQKDSLYSEYKDKVGELVNGYYQRERNGTIYVDLGKMEGVLPKKHQSPREIYQTNDRIRALIVEVKKDSNGLQIVLSRTHAEFVRAIFELEVPEIYDKIVEIHKIVREPGFRTKLAVYSNRDDVDPVGACVGLKGVRIQAVIKELEGEKIDILKYDPDPVKFIKNALSPAEVREVIIMDEGKHQALAIVNDTMLSLAIGKQGLNVRLANRLVDWNIDVKTESQFAEMDIIAESRRTAMELFGDSESYEDELSRISDLPGVDSRVAQILLDNGIDYFEDFLGLSNDELEAKGLTSAELETLRKLIEEYVEIVEEDEYEEEDEEKADEEEIEEEAEEVVEYECPECGAKITLDMTTCPSCGIGLSFEYEEEDN